MANPQHIVIIGGGAGGLELATRLGDTLGRRKQARITLVDKNRTHIWKPKLHEIAAGSMDMGDHEVDYMVGPEQLNLSNYPAIVCPPR
jgi:NADH dehydrogenase